MGKLTPDMIMAIQTEFEKCHSYKKTADKLGIDERTVKRVVSNRHGNPLSTNQKAAIKTISNQETNIEMNKTIYRELRRGRKPDEIFEKHGFPTSYVQAEYEQFKRPQYRYDRLSKKIHQ